jgi:nitrous oxidase accessory protein
MMGRHGLRQAGQIAVCLGCAAPFLVTQAWAAERHVSPGTGTLGQAVAQAVPGDTLILGPGLYEGDVVIDKTLTVEGMPGAVVDGQGTGTVIRIVAADVVVRGLTVRNSGSNQEAIDTGIFADKGGDRALIENNRLENNEFGISLRGGENAVARRNVILGKRDMRENDRGDGISVWNATGSKAIDNDIRFGRDGIRSTASRDNVFSGNRFHELRYSVHYMWTNGSTVSNNLSEGNTVGYAMMFSRNIVMTGNISVNDKAHGLLLNSVNHSVVTGNAVVDGGTECVFIYDANQNEFAPNWIAGCPVGVHFTAGSEGNRFSENAFINNQNQVMYVGTRAIEWSTGGRGNFWSDNSAFDLNGDDIADMPYRPNDVVDRVVWAVPLAKLLLNSPAIQVVRWAQAEFPAMTPGGVVDSAPLMRPPPRPALTQETSQ